MAEQVLAIRAFNAADADAVSAVIGETMRISNREDYSLDRLLPLIGYFSPEKVVQLAVERHCLVAELGGEIVGTISLDSLGQPCVELCTFFVHPDRQGSGIGSRLLQAIEDVASGFGTSQIRLEASKTGVPFYLRRGYQRTGVDVEGTAGLQIGMEKRLTAHTWEDRVQT